MSRGTRARLVKVLGAGVVVRFSARHDEPLSGLIDVGLGLLEPPPHRRGRGSCRTPELSVIQNDILFAAAESKYCLDGEYEQHFKTRQDGIDIYRDPDLPVVGGVAFEPSGISKLLPGQHEFDARLVTTWQLQLDFDHAIANLAGRYPRVRAETGDKPCVQLVVRGALIRGRQSHESESICHVTTPGGCELTHLDALRRVGRRGQPFVVCRLSGSDWSTAKRRMVTMDDKDDEAAILRWLQEGKSSLPRRRATRRDAERQQRNREALAEAEFALDASPIEQLIRECDPYSTVAATKDLALSWEATGLTPQEVARWLRRGAHVAHPSVVVRFKAARVPVDIAFRSVVRGGEQLHDTYYEMVLYGTWTPAMVYDLAVREGLLRKDIG